MSVEDDGNESEGLRQAREFQAPTEAKENARLFSFSEIQADDIKGIEEYLKFEIEQGFTTLNPKTTLEKQVAFRQSQIKEGKLKVVASKDNGKIIATSVVVLEKGTMGKDIADNEAYAAGILVDPDKRGAGIGGIGTAEQDRIAREAGKTAMRTIIANDNGPSTRLHFNVGYKLTGVAERKEETDYVYIKDLVKEPEAARPWKEEVLAGRLKLTRGEIDPSFPTELLIDGDDIETIKTALAQDYEGTALLRPEDFEKQGMIDRNAIIFAKKEKKIEIQIIINIFSQPKT